MIAKVAGGIIGLGLLGTGSIAVAKPHWFGMDYMPSWKPLSKDSNYSTAKTSDYGDGKFGNKKGNYLTGVIGNESWWEWSFRKLEKDKISSDSKPGTKFASAKNYSTSGTESINKICETAYKTQENEFSDSDTSKFKKSDVWKYCSPLGREPTTINEAEKKSYTGNIGSTESSGFISVIDEDNDMFWLIRDKEVRGSDKDNFEKVPSEEISSDHFKKSNLPMKELCRQAYETKTPEASETSNPTKADTEKYCKLGVS